MALRLEGSRQPNEVIFQIFVDSFPLRNNFTQLTDAIAAHATDIEALIAGDPASGAEVVAARDQEATLEDAVRKGDRFIGDGIERAVLDEFEVIQNSVPDDKVKVKTGGALIDGIKIRKSVEQSVDPPTFSAGSLERIDVIQLTSTGIVSTSTGTEFALGAGLAEAERPPDNTIPLAHLFLRADPVSPFPPLPIKDADDGANSFIIKDLQRFIEERDITQPHKQYNNWLRNGAFLTVALDQTIFQWTPTRGTIVRDTSPKIFGDFVGKFTGDGTIGGSFFEQQLPGAQDALRGRFVTVSTYLRLDSGTTAKTGRITIRQVGDTPESDFSQTVVLNSETWQRVHVTGYIDNSVTAVFMRIELDITDPSSVVGFIDGVQFSIGRNLTEFEYPERIKIGDDGNTEFPGGIVTDDIEFLANLGWQFPPPYDIFSNVKVFTGT